jgi:hypothetical protein
VGSRERPAVEIREDLAEDKRVQALEAKVG